MLDSQRPSAHESCSFRYESSLRAWRSPFLSGLSSGQSVSSITSGRLLLLHFPVDLIACPYSWRSWDYYGVPWSSISCLFFLNHRLVLIALSFQRPHSSNRVSVSRFQRMGTEKSGLHCICSDSLILTDLRVFVYRRQVWQRMRSCCCFESLQIVVVVGLVAL